MLKLLREEVLKLNHKGFGDVKALTYFHKDIKTSGKTGKKKESLNSLKMHEQHLLHKELINFSYFRKEGVVCVCVCDFFSPCDESAPGVSCSLN